MQDRQWDPFNGMFKRPWNTFFAYLLSIVIFAALLVLFLFAYFSPANGENTEKLDVVFTAFQVDDGELSFTTDTGAEYKVLYYKHYDNVFDNPTALCGTERFTIYADENGHIKFMEDSRGQQYITFETERAAYRSSQKWAEVGILCILLLTVGLFVLTLVVSKNPEWYPRWLVKVLFLER